MTAPNRNLVIAPVGDKSVHESWLSGPEAPKFDLYLMHFGSRPGFGRADATYYLERKGFKYGLLDHVIKQQGDLFRRYDNIWCPDDDLRVDTAGVNRLFEIFERYHLQLAQPALCKGEASYNTLRQRRGLILRYTPFVEVGAPIFSQQGFWRAAPTFTESKSGWGLDVIWPRLFRHGEMAVIDQVGVEHMSQIGKGELYENLAKLGVSAQSEFDAIVAKYGGFDNERHLQLVNGTIRLPAVREPSSPAGLKTRMIEWLGMLPKVA